MMVKAAFEIELTKTARISLRRVKDKKLLRELARVIDGLANDPAEQGVPLREPLQGLRSVRASGSRFRILYDVKEETRIVSVLLVGERRAGRETDVYALATRLVRTFLSSR